jgi:DNA-binding GntR family transcriptional regulator
VRMDIYAPDAELRLDERDLSARFGVSRTPLREALALLDNERLVKIVARRGVFIVRKTKAEILEMIAVWAALESMAARLVAEAASDADIEALHHLVEAHPQGDPLADIGAYSEANILFHQAIIKASGNPLIADIEALHHLVEAHPQGDPLADIGAYSEANILFHQAIIKASGNPLIADITDGLFIHMRAIRHRIIGDQDRVRRSVHDHSRIIAALQKRDGASAERLVREHTLTLRDHVEKYIDLN